VRTDHILFIASGAFHKSKPSDLMPELQVSHQHAVLSCFLFAPFALFQAEWLLRSFVLSSSVSLPPCSFCMFKFYFGPNLCLFIVFRYVCVVSHAVLFACCQFCLGALVLLLFQFALWSQCALVVCHIFSFIVLCFFRAGCRFVCSCLA